MNIIKYPNKVMTTSPKYTCIPGFIPKRGSLIDSIKKVKGLIYTKFFCSPSISLLQIIGVKSDPAFIIVSVKGTRSLNLEHIVEKT